MDDSPDIQQAPHDQEDENQFVNFQTFGIDASNGPNKLSPNIECTDQKFQNSICQYALELLPFVEQISLQSIGKHQG